jgi:hypothetical protein
MRYIANYNESNNNLLPGLIFILVICGLSLIQTLEKMQELGHEQSLIEYWRKKQLFLSQNLTFLLPSNSMRTFAHIVSTNRSNNSLLIDLKDQKQ